MLKIVGGFQFCDKLIYSVAYTKTKDGETELRNNVLEVLVRSFHELMFGYFEIIFYSYFGPFSYKVGFARIYFRNLLSYNKKFKFKILSAKHLKKFDDYTINELKPTACGAFYFTKFIKRNTKVVDTFKNSNFATNCLDFCKKYHIFDHDKISSENGEISRTIAFSKYFLFSDKIFDAWDSFSELRKGSLKCHLMFWSGLVVLYKQQLKNLKNQQILERKEPSHKSKIKGCDPAVEYKACNSKISYNIKSFSYKNHKACDSLLNKEIILGKKSTAQVSSVATINTEKSQQKNVLEGKLKNFKDIPAENSDKSSLVNNKCTKRIDRNSENLKNKNAAVHTEEFSTENSKKLEKAVVKNPKVSKSGELFFSYFLKKYLFAVSSYNNYLLIRNFKKYSVGTNFKEKNRLIMEITNIDEKNIINVDFNDRSNNTPHVILFDSKENELVISLRGTQSHHDALKDLDCKYVRFMEGFGHCGIVRSAQFFVKNHKKKIIRIYEKLQPKLILLTGHSLGGAIAACIHIILNEQSDFRSIRIKTITFGAPPFISENICKNINSDIVNIVHGSDLVPYLSFGTIMDLKYKCISLAKLVNKKENNYELLSKIEDFLKKQNLYPKLYLPGKIYHIIKKKSKNRDNNEKSVKRLFIRENSFFEKIIVSRNFIDHHNLNSYLSILDKNIKK